MEGDGGGGLLGYVLKHLIEHHNFHGSPSELLQFFLEYGSIYMLDLLATVAFAVTGAYAIVGYRKSSQKGLDVLGVIFGGGICTAIGGGSIRCLIASKTPFVIACPEYLIGAIIGGLFVVCFPKWVERCFIFWITLDAMGVGVFAAIGAKTAYTLNFGPHTAVFFATLTAAGGGCLRDIIARQMPGSFSGGFYAGSAFVAGITYVLFNQLTDLSQLQVMYVVTIIGFAVRMATHILDIHLPFIDGEEGKLRWLDRKPLISLRPIAQRWIAHCSQGIRTVFSFFL